MVAAAALELALGLGLLAMGRWGLTQGPDLARSRGDAEDQEHTAGIYRRGAFACLAFGAVLTVVGVIALAATIRTGQ